MVTGGLFCFVLYYQNVLHLIPQTTLIFYGLALLNASKYTLNEIRYLGLSEIVLGLVASLWISYVFFLGIWFWRLAYYLRHVVVSVYFY